MSGGCKFLWPWFLLLSQARRVMFTDTFVPVVHSSTSSSEGMWRGGAEIYVVIRISIGYTLGALRRERYLLLCC